MRARRADRVLTYQARDEGDILVAQAHPVPRAAVVKVFEDHLLARKVFIRASGIPARRYAKILEGLEYHPSVARTLVALDGEEFTRVAARAEDRFERHATYEFFDAGLRAKKKDADPAVELNPALATEIEVVVYRDLYVRLRTRREERRAQLLRGLIERFLRLNAAPRTAPLPALVAERIDRLSSSVGLSMAPESIGITEESITIALWRGRLRVTGVEAPPFVSQVNERADLRFDRRTETWQLAENFRHAHCPLGAFGYSRDYLLEGLWFDDAARRAEAFARLGTEPRPEDLEPYLRALAAEREPEVRAAGVAALIGFGEEGAKATLVAALGDEAPEVRTAAAEALVSAPALAADPRVRPEVERLLLRTEDEDEARALLRLYEVVPPGGRVPFLVGLAALKRARLLAAIVEAAGAVGAAPGEDREAAAAFVRQHTASAREDVKDAVRAARARLRRRPATPPPPAPPPAPPASEAPGAVVEEGPLHDPTAGR